MTKPKGPPKTAAERQAAHQARLRELTPLERAWKAGNLEPAILYTAEEQALVDLIKTLTDTLRQKTDRLHQLLLARFGGLPESDASRRVALSELQGSFARIQIASH